MRIFKATAAVQARFSDDVGTTPSSWELMQAELAGMSVAGLAARLDAYDAAVAHEADAHEGWRARVMSDAGETGIGDVIAVGITTAAFLGFAAWFSAYLTAVVA